MGQLFVLIDAPAAQKKKNAEEPADEALVPHQSSIDGYCFFNLTRAAAMVNVRNRPPQPFLTVTVG